MVVYELSCGALISKCIQIQVLFTIAYQLSVGAVAADDDFKMTRWPYHPRFVIHRFQGRVRRIQNQFTWNTVDPMESIHTYAFQVDGQDESV